MLKKKKREYQTPRTLLFEIKGSMPLLAGSGAESNYNIGIQGWEPGSAHTGQDLDQWEVSEGFW